MKIKWKRYISVILISSFLITGGFYVSGETVSAKEVRKSTDYKINKITGNRGGAFTYVYFHVPNSAFLNKRTDTRIKNGIIYDTYRSYWIYYSSTTGKYYP